MKVLWFCNVPFIDDAITGTGTWIRPVIDLILEDETIDLYIIAPHNVNKLTKMNFLNVNQWLVQSNYKKTSEGLPTNDFLEEIGQLVNKIKPDLIHVWGTEHYWGVLSTRNFIKNVPMLLEMQGLKSRCADIFSADLNMLDQLKCIGLKEILTRRNIFSNKRSYKKWGLIEKEIIFKADIINIQSDWMENQIRLIRNDVQLNRVTLPLRSDFYESTPWDVDNTNNYAIFFISSGPIPYKGLHTAIMALEHIKKFFPNIKLRVVGNFIFKGLRKDGYAVWLKKLATRLDVWENIEWLGPQDSKQIVHEMKLSNLNLVCSFIESYCLALAEGMYLGVPCVSAYNGGTSYVGKNSSTIFFQPGDHIDCAMKIITILNNRAFAKKLSDGLLKEGREEHSLDNVYKELLSIYNQLYINKKN